MRKVVFVLLVVTVLGAIMTQLNAQDAENISACREYRDLIADLLGLERSALDDAMNAGQTIAELALEQGVAVSDIAEALAENLKACQVERIDAIGAEMMCRLIEGPLHLELVAERQFVRPSRLNVLAAQFLDMHVGEIAQRELSLAKIAETKGISVDELVAYLIEQISQEVYRAVNRNRLSQEQADEVLATLDADVRAFVIAEPSDVQPQSLLDVARDIIGIDATEFYQKLVEGQTLANLAESNNLSLDDLRAALKAAAEHNLELEISDGRISDCVAQVRQNHLDEVIDDYVNQPNPDENPVSRSDIFGIQAIFGDGLFSLSAIPRGGLWGELGPLVPPDFIKPQFEFRGESPDFDLDIFPPILTVPGSREWLDRLDSAVPLDDCEVLRALPEVEIINRGPRGERRTIRPGEWFDCDPEDGN